MKRLFTILIIAALLICGPLQLTTLATVSYDSGESVTKNMVDALIAIANGTLPMLNDVLIVDGDRTDDYTADGSFAAPYKTIQAADTASVSGDVILVTPGAYSETVTLNSGVHLFGWNVSGATLTGEYVLFNGSTITVDGAAVVLNEGSDDVDFRVESNGGTAALFVDAGNDRVGIHTAAPTAPLEVTGNTLITGALTTTGAVDFGGNVTLANDETITNGTDGQIDLNGNVYLNGAVKLKAACTIADGDATPDVAGCSVMITSANTGPTEITDLDNPVVGSIIMLIGGSATNSSTISDAANFALSAAWTAGLDDILILYVQADNDYIEISRSDN